MGIRIKGPTGVKAKPVCFVVHTAEGCRTAECIVDYLAPKGISVPFCADPDKILRTTPEGYLGYGHAAGLTGKASGVELAGFASWSRRQWEHEGREMVRAAGQLAAYVLGAHYPVTKRMLKKRVIGHAQDSRFGGTSDHWDPGPGFPYDICIEDALAWAGGPVRLSLRVMGDVAKDTAKDALAALKKVAKRFGLSVRRKEHP